MARKPLSALKPGRDRHAKERERKALFDRKRGNAASRGYGRAWRKRRMRLVIERGSVCAHCGCDVVLSEKEAIGSIRVAHLDHEVSRRDGGSDDDDNLQVLCNVCHSRKTAKEDSDFAKRAR